MPVGRYDSAFGGKPGSAGKALDAMRQEYGQAKGTSVFYATKNKRVKRMAPAKVRRIDGGS